jgi:F-type H+-transporting ATPase subunit gamma
MTERLADISARIEGVRALGAVVNAMKGIAAARAHMARDEVLAVDSYAATIAGAIALIQPVIRRVIRPVIQPSDAAQTGPPPAGDRPALLVFCAEQGFAGAFSERVLDSLDADLNPAALFLIGTRGLSIAKARGLTPQWSAPLPSHTPGLPKLADKITRAIYAAVAQGRRGTGAQERSRAGAQGSIDSLDVVFTTWHSGRPSVERQRLFPIDLANLANRPPHGPLSHGPLTQLPDAALIEALGQEYFNALVCKAALHAFAAENEARMQAMTSAGSQIARELETFQATLRRVRQEAITAEIIELGTGAATAR